MHRLLLVILSSVMLTACNVGQPYETGQYVSEHQMSQFNDGKTTQADVVAAIGHPNKKAQLSGKELWYYDYTKIVSFGTNINESSAFEFNSKGKLIQHYKTGARSQKTGNALIDAANGQ